MQLSNSSGTEGEEEVGVVEALGVLGMVELVGVVDSVEVVAGIVVAPPCGIDHSLPVEQCS